jgi:hypothetical protein
MPRPSSAWRCSPPRVRRCAWVSSLLGPTRPLHGAALSRRGLAVLEPPRRCAGLHVVPPREHAAAASSSTVSRRPAISRRLRARTPSDVEPSRAASAVCTSAPPPPAQQGCSSACLVDLDGLRGARPRCDAVLAASRPPRLDRRVERDALGGHACAGPSRGRRRELHCRSTCVTCSRAGGPAAGGSSSVTATRGVRRTRISAGSTPWCAGAVSAGNGPGRGSSTTVARVLVTGPSAVALLISDVQPLQPLRAGPS